MAESSTIIEQEIARLEQQLREKKLALGGQETGAKEMIPSDKEILHEIVGEKIQKSVPAQQATPSDDNAATQQAPAVEPPSYLTPELKDKIQQLVDLAFSGSLVQAIQEVSKTNNAALIDAFHDVIVDELYNALVERKKLEKVS
ncbi:MAG: hypothetical protein UY02_C0029G0008 [Candidatus Giovannonibacteria bacterium GW2011_GWB1_47_6b]|uniref:Uncharacterized protein n=1 Tax=Candidatus Giovannonibacteria bacterium GW2011_GWB1_47_6b TaxID=1618655 RepID=A0A0G1W1P0_9BACT|nr:MAG: hypothetical protein UY02_C0029G0008 [Candidatus Giovannonibacteria bacterium GW2011_GWB1_47_6b]